MRDPDPENATAIPEEHRQHLRKIIGGTYKPDYNVLAQSIEQVPFWSELRNDFIRTRVTELTLGPQIAEARRRLSTDDTAEAVKSVAASLAGGQIHGKLIQP